MLKKNLLFAVLLLSLPCGAQPPAADSILLQIRRMDSLAFTIDNSRLLPLKIAGASPIRHAYHGTAYTGTNSGVLEKSVIRFDGSGTETVFYFFREMLVKICEGGLEYYRLPQGFYSQHCLPEKNERTLENLDDDEAIAHNLEPLFLRRQ